MKEMEFDIASFREFKDSYKEEVIQSNIGKTKCEIDVILEEMYIAYINEELNINVSTLKEAKRRRKLAYLKKYYKGYHAANKEKLYARQKEYYAANKEKIAEYYKGYHAANKDKIAAQKKEYYAANKEKINSRRRELYAKRREEKKD